MANEGIELEICSYQDPRVVKWILPGRVDPQMLEEVAGPGGGSFQISRFNPKYIKDPTMLDSRNVVKFRVDGDIRGAFLIQGKESIIVGSGEQSSRGFVVSGEGLKAWFDDAEVKPMTGSLELNSRDVRSFNFASEQGDWYKPADWVNGTIINGVRDTYSAWGVYPEKWPAVGNSAQWVAPGPLGPLPNHTMPTGRWYARHDFTVTQAGLYAIYTSVDDSFNLFLDGEQLVAGDQAVDSWKNTVRIEVYLPTGNHILAYSALNTGGPTALVMAMVKIAENGTETLHTRSGQGTWKVLPFPTREPGWSIGEIVLKLLAEAEARGVLFPQWLTPTFTSSTMSDGSPWPDPLAWQFKVGESYASVISKFEELVDIWIDPATLELNIVGTRGTNRSQLTSTTSPVEFKVGKNLREARTESRGKIKNSLSMKTLEGWTEEEASSSILKYGRIEGSMDTGASLGLANTLASAVFAQRAVEEEGASYDIIPGKYKPFRDYGPGDWVLAPNDRGLQVPRRILSISVNEGPSGDPRYTIEFDTIFQDNEHRMSKAIAKLGGGGVGGGMSNVAGSTPGIGGPIILPPTMPSEFLIPLAPAGFDVISMGVWDSNGVHPVSIMLLEWNDVTLNEDGTATVPSYYEVQGQQQGISSQGWEAFGSSTVSSMNLSNFVPGTDWKFRVRAVNPGEVAGDWTILAYTVTAAAPTTPPIAPSKPTLFTDSGNIYAAWDGKMSSGLTPAKEVRYIYADLWDKSLPESSRVVAGNMLQRSGEIILPGLIPGRTYRVRFRAVDGVGLVSSPSEFEEIVVLGVNLGDLDQEVKDAIEAAQAAADAAQSTANSANTAAGLALTTAESAETIANNAIAQATDAANDAAAALSTADGMITTSLVAPVVADGTGKPLGALWFRRTAGGIITGQWEWDGAAWLSQSLDNAVIANLNAGKITAGFLDVARLQASSIGTEKLRVGDLSNLATINESYPGSITYGLWTSTIVDGWSARSVITGTSTEYFMFRNQTGPLPFKTGDRIRFSLEAYADAAIPTVNVQLWVYGGVQGSQALGQVALTTTPTTFTGEANVTVDTTGRTSFLIGFTNPNLVGRDVRVRNVRFYRMGAGELIVDGSIIGDKLVANTITGGKIAANTISTNNMLITSLDNLIEDGSFEYSNISGVAWSLTSSNDVIENANPRTGSRSLRITTTTAARVCARTVGAFKVEAGQQFRVEAWVRVTSGVMTPTGVTLRFAYGATEASTITAGPDLTLIPEATTTTYVIMGGVWTVPTGAKFARLDIVTRGTVAGVIYNVDDVAVYKMAEGKLIVDGAVTATKIAAQAIVTEHLSAGSVATPHLQAQAVTSEKVAADTITSNHIVAGAIKTNHVEAGAIKTSHISPEVGQELILEGNPTVTIIAGRIDGVEADTEATASELQTMRMYYDFTPEGAIISKPGSPFATRIDNDSIDMLENGNVISYWNSGTLYVNQLVGERVTLGNHQLAKFEGGTVVRALT